MDFYKGFCAQCATASSIIIGSGMGLPLSTTHCMIGALVGIVVGGKLKCIERIYKNVKDVEAILA